MRPLPEVHILTPERCTCGSRTGVHRVGVPRGVREATYLGCTGCTYRGIQGGIYTRI